MLINETRIEGNLTREPELKDVPALGKTVLSFGIAQTPKKKDASGNWIDGETSFFDVEFWPSDPQFWAQRLTKGTSVIVFGHLKQERWEHEEKQMSRIKIIADDITSKWIPTVEWQNRMKEARNGQGNTAQAQQSTPAYTPVQNTPFPEDMPLF